MCLSNVTQSINRIALWLLGLFCKLSFKRTNITLIKTGFISITIYPALPSNTRSVKSVFLTPQSCLIQVFCTDTFLVYFVSSRPIHLRLLPGSQISKLFTFKNFVVAFLAAWYQVTCMNMLYLKTQQLRGSDCLINQRSIKYAWNGKHHESIYVLDYMIYFDCHNWCAEWSHAICNIDI